jgi:hypothetical protein
MSKSNAEKSTDNTIKFEALKVQRMPTRSNQRRIEWDVVVPAETTVEDLLNPIFWSHVAGSTFHGDMNFVLVHWEDRSQLAELYVRQYYSTSAKMELLKHYEFDKSDVLIVPDKYEVKWTGPHTKFRITRKEDNQIIQDGFGLRDDAVKFIGSLPK